MTKIIHNFSFRSAVSILAFGFAILTGCMTTSNDDDLNSTANSPASTGFSTPETITKGSKPRPIEFSPIPTETFFDLLVAEIAGDRKEFGISLAKYTKQAFVTRDIQIVERATRLAIILNADSYVLELSSLWTELEPNNIEANRIAAYFLGHARQLNKAFPHAIFMLQHGESETLRNIANFADNAPSPMREQLLEQYRQLSPELAQNEDVLFTKATILWQQNDIEPALTLARQILANQPFNTNATILVSQLMAQQGNTPEALSFIEQALKESSQRQPIDNKRLNIQYARLLALIGNFEASRQELSDLVAQEPDDIELLFSLTLITVQVGDNTEVKNLLARLPAESEQTSSANYYFAKSLDRQGEVDEAMIYYRQVRNGPDLVPAAGRLAALMSQQGQLVTAQLYLQQLRDEQPQQVIGLIQLEAEILIQAGQVDDAYQLITQALKTNKNDLELLYIRSIVNEKRQQYQAMEMDLRTILGIEPDSAMTLNALGYALSNHSSRYQEAYELINKALQIQPNDAATLDSMGWVLYRLDQPQQALTYLQKALAQLPDPEVAAHLGEVLWALDRKDDALSVWQTNLQANPGAPIIVNTMQRLQAASE